MNEKFLFWGSGIFAAAYDLKMEWVVVKGVSDYADGNKSKTEAWQPFASVMAASVVENIVLITNYQCFSTTKPV